MSELIRQLNTSIIYEIKHWAQLRAMQYIQEV